MARCRSLAVLALRPMARGVFLHQHSHHRRQWLRCQPALGSEGVLANLPRGLKFALAAWVGEDTPLLTRAEDHGDQGRDQCHQHADHDKGDYRPLSSVPEVACRPEEEPHGQRDAA